MKKYVPIFIVLMSEVFFAVSSIVGFEYQGKESSMVFISYNIIMFLLAIIIFCSDVIKNNLKFKKNSLISLSLLLIITFFYLFDLLFRDIDAVATTRYLYFLLWPGSSILMGVYVAQHNRYRSFIKSLDIIMIIFTLSAIFSLYSVLSTNMKVNIGGANYQHAGYIFAFAYGINLYFLTSSKKHVRFDVMNTKFSNAMCFMLLFIQIASIFATGARGPILLSIIYSIYPLKSFIFLRRKLLIKVLVIVSSLILVIYFWPKLVEYPRFQSSWARAFSYITDEGINLANASGRNIVYYNAINAIKESLVVGHGVFGAYTYFQGYTHNILLDILIQGGLILFFIYVIISTLIFQRILKLIKYNKDLLFLMVLLLHPLVMLLFSGTYINNAILWFVISFVISYSARKRVESTTVSIYPPLIQFQINNGGIASE